jgi:DNA-binding CsgD family transcriptional regulator
MPELTTAQSLTDRLYEAAIVPELWPEALLAFTELAGAEGSVLIAARGTEFSRWIVSAPEFAGIVEAHQRYAPNIRTARLIAANYAGFMRDRDVLTQHEIDNEPLYQDLLRPSGYGFGVATAIFAPSGDNIIVHAEFSSSHGEASAEAVACLDQLRPHLARAALLSSRLGLERAHAMADALALLGVPGAVLRAKGRVFAANPQFESLMPGLIQDRHDRLKLTDADADLLFQQALAAVSLASCRSMVNSIPVAAAADLPPMIVHLIPVRGAAHDVFSQATALLVVTPVDRAVVPTAHVLQGLFDLTPAESRLAGMIAQAQTPREAALGLGITEETARTTLKRIFSKTGTRRQAELVSLLGGSGMVSPELK